MKRDLIYDVGMNNGDDTAYYLHRGYRVVAIEADPTLAQQAAKRFKMEVASGQLIILNVAIAEREGILPFWICETVSEWNSFDRSIASRNGYPHHSIDVTCRTFSQVLNEYGVPYYLKIDIEGYDYLCLEALDSMNAPDYVSFEMSDNSMKLLSYLEQIGYSSFKCISQTTFLPLQKEPLPRMEQAINTLKWDSLINRNSLKYKVVRRLGGRKWLESKWRQLRDLEDWVFPTGSSGTFGPLTSGRWLSKNELYEVLVHFDGLRQKQVQTPYWHVDSSQDWNDIHLRHENAEK